MTFEDAPWLQTEARLLDRVRRGDRAAFAELYRTFSQPLYARVILPRLGNADLAADALAETFRAFLEHLGGFQDRGKGIWGWLATLAGNKANDVFRTQARGGRALSSYQALLAPLWQQLGPPRPDEVHEQQSLHAAVADILATINPRYRQAIELRVLQDLSRDECAAALAVSQPTFDVLLLRALRAFRKNWQERYPGPEASP